MALKDRFPELASPQGQIQATAVVQAVPQKPLDQLTQVDFDAMSSTQRRETLARAGVFSPLDTPAEKEALLQGASLQPAQAAQGQTQADKATSIAQRFPELQAPVVQAVQSQNELIRSGDIPLTPEQSPVQASAQQSVGSQGVDPSAPGFQFPNVLQDFPPAQAVLQAQAAVEAGTARGAIKFVSGAGQLAAGIMEKLGIVQEGQAARVTQGAETLQEQVAPLGDIPSTFQPLVQGAETLTQVAPFLSVPLAPTAGRAIAQSGGLGALSGGTSFIQDPDEAGLSLERGSRAVIGLGVGIALPAATAAIGGVKQAFGKADVPRQLTTRIEEAGPKTLSRREALLAQESLEAGFPVTPSAATGSRVIAGKETRVVPTEARQFKAEAAITRGERAGQRLSDDFLDTVLPERGATEPLRQQIDDLYTVAKGDQFDTVLLAQQLKDKKIQRTFGALKSLFDKKLKNDPVLAAEIGQHPENSIARLDAMKRFIDKEARKLNKAPSFDKLGEKSVDTVRRTLIDVGDISSDAYSKARNLAHRSKIVENIDARLAGKAVGDEAPLTSVDVTPIDFFKGVLRTKKQMTELFKDLRSIKDPKIRSDSIAKAKKLRRVLSRWTRTQPVLEKLSKGDPRTIQERSQIAQSIIFTTKRLVERQKSNAMVDFLTSDKWASDVLDGAIRAKSPVQLATELGNFINLISTRSPIAEDAAGFLGLEERE